MTIKPKLTTALSKLTATNTLVVEFSALFILIGSLYFLGQKTQAGIPVSTAMLSIPLAASALFLTAFIGNMYVRWIKAAEGKAQRSHKIIFGLFALTLFGVWSLALAKTLISIEG